MSTLLPTLPTSNTLIQGALNRGVETNNITTRWNPRTGGETRLSFEGTEAQILAIATDCQTLGLEYNLTTGATWHVEVLAPWDWLINDDQHEPPPRFVWEFGFQPFEVDILELSQRPLLSVLSSNTKRNIEIAIRTPENKTLTLADNDNINAALEAKIVYNLKLAHIETRQDFVPILKRSMVVSNNFDLTSFVRPDLDNKLFTKAELLVTYDPNSSIPSVIEKMMPRTIRIYSSNGLGADVEGYTIDQNAIVSYVGYRQLPAELTPVSLNKIQANQQWVLNQWVAGRYGLYDTVSGNPGPSKTIVQSIAFGGTNASPP